MVFLAVPLLKLKRTGPLRHELVQHAGILMSIVVLVLLIRILLGEERVAQFFFGGSSIITTILRIGAAVIIGPFVSLALFFFGPIGTLAHWDQQLTIVFAGFSIVMICVLWRLKFEGSAQTNSPARNDNEIAEAAARYKLFVTAVIMLCLAYLVSFTHFPPIARYGRETSVHLAAAFGASLLFASICDAFLASANRYYFKRCALTGLGFYFSLLVTYRFSYSTGFQAGMAASTLILDRCYCKVA